jgi:thiol-disulfide isomerase/thioredoxin
MKRILSLAILLISCTLAVAQSGYNIPITLKPYKNTWIYLGYYYGKVKALADSALLDADSKGVFKGTKPLEGGIYFIVSPRKEILFEILIDKQQQFAISADSATLPNRVVFTGSPENALFQTYTNFTNDIGRQINKTNTDFSTAKNAKDSAKLKTRLKALTERMQTYRDSMIAKQSNSFLTALFQAMKEPVVPPAAQHPGGKYDSMYAYRYYKSHYWDGVSFSDGRLVRTPFFEAKLEKYYKELVVPAPDSITREVDHMLLYARSSSEMFKFLLVHFVQKYINPEYMGQDAVFVHLFEKYINTGQADFFTQQYKDFMFKRAYSLMANLIGQPAANLEMVDTLDKPKSLYNIKSDFTVICFWDPTCSHCKEVVPKVDSIYQAKWKKEGVVVYGVMVDGGKDNWKKFINDNKLTDWVHVYQLPAKQQAEEAAGKPNYRQLYDVYQTPILYLLDKDKHIIAKKLTYLQLNEVIDLKLKNKKIN